MRLAVSMVIPRWSAMPWRPELRARGGDVADHRPFVGHPPPGRRLVRCDLGRDLGSREPPPPEGRSESPSGRPSAADCIVH